MTIHQDEVHAALERLTFDALQGRGFKHAHHRQKHAVLADKSLIATAMNCMVEPFVEIDASKHSQACAEQEITRLVAAQRADRDAALVAIESLEHKRNEMSTERDMALAEVKRLNEALSTVIANSVNPCVDEGAVDLEAGIAQRLETIQREGANATDADWLVSEVVRLEKGLAEMTRERNAYLRAKQENDERFMIERDEAREERDRLRKALDVHETGIPRDYAVEIAARRGEAWDATQEALNAAIARAEAAERDRDNCAESDRMAHDRIQRLVDGGKVLDEERSGYRRLLYMLMQGEIRKLRAGMWQVRTGKNSAAMAGEGDTPVDALRAAGLTDLAILMEKASSGDVD